MRIARFPLAPFKHALLFSGSTAVFALAGCSISSLVPVSDTPAAVSLHGHVHGGQQPVSASLIQLFAAGSAGNGSSATQVLVSAPVYTDVNGAFDITGDYSCPSPNAQMYITATGGNPGLAPGTDNAALALVAVIGNCSTLASTPSLTINEVTTVAAAWALAPFATSIGNVGSSVTNVAGLANAMQNALTLADSTTGGAPSALLPANATTETAKLYTLANIIASCVNSDGSSPCAQLFTDASPSISSNLTDTFQAALSVVTNPGNNVTQLFYDAPGLAAFGGGLSVAPNDWTMSIAYTGGGLDSPASLAIDANGNVLVTSVGGALSGFSPQGTPLWLNGVSGSGLDQSVGIAIDASSNIWVSNMLSANNITPGSLTQFSPTGTVLSGATGFTGSSINTPSNIAADANGNIWVSNLGLPEITLLASNGTVLSGMSGYGGNILVQPAGLAIDSTQNAWVSDASIGYLYQFDNQGVLQHLISCCNNPDSLAIDSAGVLWAGDNANSDLTAATPLGVILQSNLSGGGLNGPRSISVDGGDHLWITNNNGSTLTEFAGTNSPQVPGSALSPSTGFGADAQMQQPFGVGIDPSGNVWVSSFGDNRLINFVGLGTPVKTPRIGPPQQP